MYAVFFPILVPITIYSHISRNKLVHRTVLRSSVTAFLLYVIKKKKKRCYNFVFTLRYN